MKAIWPALALTALMIVGSACLDDSITGTRTLTFSLSADPTSTTVGQTVTFRYEGTGTRIQGVVVDYGDGLVDSVFTPGTVVEVGGEFRARIRGLRNIPGRRTSRDGPGLFVRYCDDSG